jgi:hypothetical protein
MNNSVTLLDIQDKLDALANNLNTSFTQITKEKMQMLEAQIATLGTDLREELGQEIIYNIKLNNNLQGYYKCEVYTILITEENYANRFYTVPTVYKIGSNNLRVHYAGISMRKGEDDDYLEIDETTIKFNYDLKPGLVLELQVTNAITTELELFELPIATDTRRGIVKQGANISISTDGTISALMKDIPAIEIIQDTEHKFVTNAQITRWNDTYTKNEIDFMITSWGHPIATKNEVGLIKAGKNLQVDFDGTLNVMVDQYIDPRAIEETDQYQFITTYERELITVIPHIMETMGIPYPEFEPDPDDYQLVNAQEKSYIQKIPWILEKVAELELHLEAIEKKVGLISKPTLAEIAERMKNTNYTPRL